MNWLKIDDVLLEYTRKATNVIIKPDLPHLIMQISILIKLSKVQY